MPGLGGRFGRGEVGANEARAILEPLAAPGDRVSSSALGPVALAHGAVRVAVEQGGVERDGNLLVALHGYVLDGGDARGVGGERQATKRALAAYRAGGVAALGLLNGVYALALWDATARRLVLAHDRLGLGGLYYRSVDGGIAFASRPRALAPLGTVELDAAALGQLLSLSYVGEDRTLWRDIRALGPGCALVVADGRSTVERVWEPPSRSEDIGDVAAQVTQLAGALDVAVGDALADSGDDARLVLPLSGGLDSRVIAGFARHHRRPSTLTYGHRHAWDVRFAARIARRAGGSHRRVKLGEDYMARYGWRLVQLTEGQASVHASHIVCLLPELARRPSLTLSGFLGDALTGGHLGWVGEDLGDIRLEGQRLFERVYRVAFDDAGLGRVLRSHLRADAQGAAAQAVLALHAAGGDSVSRADRVDLDLRQHRFVSYQLDVLGRVSPVRAPFADARVIDVCMRWPEAARRRQLAYLELVRTAHPDLARVPVASTGVPLAGPLLGLRRGLEHLRWRTLPRLSAGHIRPHDYRQFAHYDDWIRGGSRSFFQALFENTALLGEVFEPKAVRELFEAHLARRVNAFQELSAVATVALWLRTFAGVDAGDSPGAGDGAGRQTMASSP